MENKGININEGNAILAIVLACALFIGEPDLVDSLIHFFMSF